MADPAHSGKKVPSQYIRGFPFPFTERFRPENIESALAYEPQEGDVFLVTYPKSGTTWVQYIIYDILHAAEVPLPSLREMARIMPYMEIEGAAAAMALSPPRVIKYHIPYHLTPKSPFSKYISIIRNPYDTAVSYFYFLRNITSIDLQFDEFVDDFISGDAAYGSYFDNVLSWYEKENEPNVLLLSYDKMTLDPKRGLLKIAKFLGQEYFDRLSKDEALVKKILERTSFAFMKKYLIAKKNENKEYMAEPHKGTTMALYPETFFRKATVGEYRNHFTEQQTEKMKIWIKEKSGETEVEKFWAV